MQRAQLSNDGSSFTKSNTNITVLLHLFLCIQGLGLMLKLRLQSSFVHALVLYCRSDRAIMCYSLSTLQWQYLVSRCVLGRVCRLSRRNNNSIWTRCSTVKSRPFIPSILSLLFFPSYTIVSLCHFFPFTQSVIVTQMHTQHWCEC